MIEHAIRKIAQTKVQKDPFPYFFSEPIFPEEYYQELLIYLT